VGVVLFCYGARINWQVDVHLTRLRQQNAGYQIPIGGWFDAFGVSAPHYWGEMVQWMGFAFAANGSIAAVPLSLASNLLRCCHHVYQQLKVSVKHQAVIPYLW
jgi:hypothetical protein